VLQFSDFDGCGYRTVDVRTGYGEWVASYEETVLDAMDLELLETLVAIPWGTLRSAADLGCGTGRTGAWLRRRGLAVIDGVDLTPEMLVVARSTGTYRRALEGDLASTGLPSAAYDVVSICLVDEHLAELRPMYREAWRLARPGGFLVLVGYHPHFIMAAGLPTHLHPWIGRASGDRHACPPAQRARDDGPGGRLEPPGDEGASHRR
jgi:SAM-dependent methyltransferase